MYSQPLTLRRPKVGEIVQTYNADEAGHYVEEYKVTHISDDKIKLEHLRHRRYSGVSEVKSTITEGESDLIDYLSVPTDIQWQKHWRSTIQLEKAVTHGTCMEEWSSYVQGLRVPSPP